jgi:hypothetical protein
MFKIFCNYCEICVRLILASTLINSDLFDHDVHLPVLWVSIAGGYNYVYSRIVTEDTKIF